MTVNVTAKDIARGCPLSRTHCPIARAIGRKCNAKHIHAQYTYIHIGTRKYATPARIAKWMMAYDRNESVHPVRFELL